MHGLEFRVKPRGMLDQLLHAAVLRSGEHVVDIKHLDSVLVLKAPRTGFQFEGNRGLHVGGGLPSVRHFADRELGLAVVLEDSRGGGGAGVHSSGLHVLRE